jgi:outer membrane protein assembly factor BamB
MSTEEQPALPAPRGSRTLAALVVAALALGVCGAFAISHYVFPADPASSDAAPTPSGSAGSDGPSVTRLGPGQGWTASVGYDAIVGEHAVYSSDGRLVFAHDPDSGAVRWRADLGNHELIGLDEIGDGLLVASGATVDPTAVTIQDTSAVIDEATGRILAKVDAEILAPAPGGQVLLGLNTGRESACACEQLLGVDRGTGRPLWTVDLSPDQSPIAEGAALGWIGFQDLDGTVRRVDPVTGDVTPVWRLPATALPAGTRFANWVFANARDAVLVADDVRQRAVISGIDLTTGAVRWSRAVIRPRSGGLVPPMSAIRCGGAACVAEPDGIAIVDPLTGRTNVVKDAVQVIQAGSVWAARYRAAGSTGPLDSLALLDPVTAQPGARINFFTPVGVVGSRLVGLRYVDDQDTPQPYSMNDKRDTLIIAIGEDGTQTTIAHLTGGLLPSSCAAGFGHIACWFFNQKTLRVLPVG